MERLFKAPPVAGLYLHVFHGRNSPTEDLEDWGFEGPYIGPLESFGCTYGSLKFTFLGDDETTHLDDIPNSGIFEDLIVVEGKYYGDYVVMVYNP